VVAVFADTATNVPPVDNPVRFTSHQKPKGPIGNVTVMSFMIASLGAKMLEPVRELVLKIVPNRLRTPNEMEEKRGWNRSPPRSAAGTEGTAEGSGCVNLIRT
jgi:hypothetical protein